MFFACGVIAVGMILGMIAGTKLSKYLKIMDVPDGPDFEEQFQMEQVEREPTPPLK